MTRPSETRDQLDARVRSAFKHPEQGFATAIIRGGDVVWEALGGSARRSPEEPVTRDTIFAVASVTKTMAAMCVARAVDEGCLDLSADVNDYLKHMTVGKKGRRPVTLRDLLTHSAGLSDIASLSGLLGSLRPDTKSDPDALDPSVVKHLGAHVTPECPPGEKFSYANAGFMLVGQILEDTLGRPFAEIVSDSVFDRAQMPTAYCAAPGVPEPHLTQGYDIVNGALKPVPTGKEPWAEGCVRASLNDMLGYARALLEPSEAGFPARWLDNAFSNHYLVAGRFEAQGLSFARDNVGGYATVGHGGNTGGFTSYLLLVPELKLGVVVLMNTMTVLGAGALAYELLYAELGLPSPSVKSETEIDVARAATLTGRYTAQKGWRTNLVAFGAFGGAARVAITNGELTAKGRFGLVRPAAPLLPTADPGRFHLIIDGFPLGVDFFEANDSTPAGFYLHSVNLVMLKR